MTKFLVSLNCRFRICKSHVLFLVFSPQKRRHGSCRVEHSGDHGNLGYNELRHDSGARHECFVKKA